MARVQYVPNTIIPDDPEGLKRYLQEELDKLAFVIANLDSNTTGDDGEDGGEGTPPTDHSTLTGRGNFDQHPQSAITNLVQDQNAQDLLIDRNTKVFFQVDEPPADEVSEGDIWFYEGYD